VLVCAKRERERDAMLVKKTTCHVLILTPFSVLERKAPSTITSCTCDHEFDFPRLPILKDVDQN
jgi:hypothetical protein